MAPGALWHRAHGCRGYASRVRGHVVFHKKSGLNARDTTPSSQLYDQLKRFRAGIEAGIRYLKRCCGLSPGMGNSHPAGCDQGGKPPWNPLRGKDVKTQGVSVRATRNPLTL